MTITSKLLKLTEEADFSEEAEIIRAAFWKITELKAKKYFAAHPYEDCPRPIEWQPIDYSLANTGQAPFDGKDFIGRHENGFFLLMKFSSLNSEDDRFQAEAQGPTHWMPVPEFMKDTP